ncbi:MAG TPA: OmpH family outer membrane protein [Blastocatellia bacterium]|jgi:outer membrane protein|nr:OmpH family outer membrane protein [Blastocatellia bacterium]
MRIPLAFAIIALSSLVAFAQTTPQPPRSASQNPATSGGGSGAQGKIAIINTAALRVGIGEFKATLEALDKEFESKNNELAGLQKQIEELKNKVQSSSPAVKPSERDGWMEQGAELEKTFKRKSEDYQTLFQRRGLEMVSPITDKINKFFDQYCQQRNIVILLERQVAENSNILVWSQPMADITEDFINEYNKAHPSSTPAATKK